MQIILFTTESEYSYILLKDLINTRDGEIKGIYVSKLIKYNKILKILRKKVIGGLGFWYYFKRIIYNFKHEKNKNTIYELAKKYNIPVYYTSNINDFTLQIKNSKPNVIISGYLDHIIRPDLIAIPSFGIINVHLSMLPKCRGVKPVFWTIKNNESYSGVSLHLMEKGIDTGDLLDQKEIKISETDSVDTLTKKLSEEGAKLLIHNLNKIERNEYVLKKQDNSMATYFSQPTKKDLKQFLEAGKKFY